MTSLAVDIGAESGRVVAGTLNAGKLEIREISRFPNTPFEQDGSLRWNIQDLIDHVRNGIQSYNGNYQSVGVDTWGVDYVLLNADHQLIEQPYHYRDSRTNGMIDEVAKTISREDIYRETGIQFLPFNTLFQLAATPKETLTEATHFLTIPDYIHHQLSEDRQIVCEYTNATTTQCLDAKTGTWSTFLLDQLGIPSSIFPEIVPPGSKLGKLAFGNAHLIAPACHDTGSAVVAIPSTSANVAWISSGTWSILGVESKMPLISDRSYRANYTNEGGVMGTVRLCKNVMGLWILQECRRIWGDVSYAELMAEAQSARSIGAWINPDDPRFLPPGDMPSRVYDYLAETEQEAPATRGELVRVILESLALKYRTLVDQLEDLVGYRLDAIHIFGGGCQNSLLNQLTANACGRPVAAGPVEATAIGNLLMQMITLGSISSLAEARKIVRTSFACDVFEPQSMSEWQSNSAKFSRLIR